LLATLIVGAVAAMTMFTAPISASAVPPPTPVLGFTPNVGLTYCAPLVVAVGTSFDFDVSDSEQTSGFDVELTGALPDGLTIKQPIAGLAYRISGTPTKVGSYNYTMRFDNGFSYGERACSVDVVAATSILGRIAGDDRYNTALSIAGQVSSGAAPLIYVASGENYPDALSAAAIAAQHGAPLILTQRREVPPDVYSVLFKYAPKNIVIIGGENAVSRGVEGQLKGLSNKTTVSRIGGADRYEVSRNLITDPTFGARASTSIAIATGNRFPDALSATPPAGRDAVPVLLVNGDSSTLSPDEKALLTTRGVSSATLLGGVDTVSAGIGADVKAITGTVTRIEGDDRFVTSANVVKANYTGPIDTVYLATGENFPDALTGGVLAAVTKSPILLVHKSCMATEVADQVRALAPKDIVLLGGANVLSADLETLPICS
jgi:putative cell wall-binding protein